MKKQKHTVELTSEDRQTLETLVRRGEHNALEIRRAHILLKADVKGPAWTDVEIAAAFGCHPQTVYNVRKRWIAREGLPALKRKPQSRPSRLPKLDGQGEARLIALCCSDPPEGFSQWTLQLLADKLVDLEIVESISLEAVRQTLKKTPYVRIASRRGGSRRPKMRRLLRRWRRFWMSTSGLRILRFLLLRWTNVPCSCLTTCVPRYVPNLDR